MTGLSCFKYNFLIMFTSLIINMAKNNMVSMLYKKTEIQQAILTIQESAVNNYCLVASAALFFYDYITTISQEAQVVWCRKLTGASLLYILNQYVMFVYLLCYMVASLYQTIPCERCQLQLRLISEWQLLMFIKCQWLHSDTN
ncbi:hypothetical protein AcV7_003600 [Taiwanofungus camphoratus]|nr:hypothetical protein AcV7_003600 [Antrodia cinnamomea]